MGKNETNQTNAYHIYPLSPVIEEEGDISEYEIYKGYLDSAFNTPDIRNIAITGNFGIGKSCFLRYYAKQKQKSTCSYPDVASIHRRNQMLIR